jgi:poly(3-hydroxybutyrate) depolymerase
MTRLLFILLSALVLLQPARLQAQAERFELGQHLRLMEAAWVKNKDAEARKRALPYLQKAFTSFFLGNPGQTAETLDRARFALISEKDPAPEVRWAESLSLTLESRFLDTSAKDIPFILSSFYKARTGVPKEAELSLSFSLGTGNKGEGKRVGFGADIDQLPFKSSLPLFTLKETIREGDYHLRVGIRAGGKALLQRDPSHMVSFATQLEKRVKALNEAIEKLPAKNATTQQETVRGLVRLLNSLSQKKQPETNYPAARLLRQTEEAVKALAAGKSYFGQKKPGQFWLWLATGKSVTPVRLAAPKEVEKGQPLPLVLVLHGAGGSENMFFDVHGPGRVVANAQKRGWLLVAPRSAGLGTVPPVAEIIDEVDKLYPVDRKKVFVVGHSMGGMQTVRVAQQAPQRFAAVAPLSGAGRIQASDALKKLPFFVGVGDQDVLLAGSRGLKEGLQKAGVERLEYREYPNVEHITTVIEALDDVFAFFDEAAK